MASDTDNSAAGEYWAIQMDAAYEFMESCLRVPLFESGEPVVPLVPAIDAASVTVLFSDRPHVAGSERIFVLREGLVDPLLHAAAELNARGWTIRVEDAYRTRTMQQGLATDRAVLTRIVDSILVETRGEVPPSDLVFRRVSALVATRAHVATHMSGSALDISVIELDSGEELDRGGPYLEMSGKTPMGSPYISQAQAELRRTVTAVLGRHGFVAYPYEFWHYSAGDVFAAQLAGQEVLYGPISYDPVAGTQEPTPDDESLLVTPDELRRAVATLLDTRRSPR
jgi:D-alanyl-D-alanine dipeptidase